MKSGTVVWEAGQEKKLSFIIFLSILCGLSPFAMAIIVPSLPSLAQSFNVDYDSLQYIISAYLIGIGLAQPIHGFLCDRYGRRPVLLLSFLLFTVASFACAIADNWHVLIMMRFIQAIGVSVGTVTSRAIVNDVSTRQDAAQILSYLAMAMGLSPIIAPIIGGYLDTIYGWQSGFLFSGGLGGFILVFAYFRLAETRPEICRKSMGSFYDILSRYGMLLRSPVFMGYTLVFGFCQGAFFAFLPVAPQVFASDYNIGTEMFGYYWALLSIAYMSGAFCSGKLVRLFDLDQTLGFGCIGIFIAIMVLWAVSWGDAITLFTLMSTIMMAMFFSGIASPLSLTGSISHNPEMAGVASGLSSSLGMGVGALFSLATGYMFDGSLSPIINLMAISALGCLAAFGLSLLGRRQMIKI